MTTKRSRRRYSSTIYQFQHPDWEPLLGLAGAELARWFMWMGELRLSDGTRVHGYKHVETRRYLHLSPDGRAFEYLVPASFGDERPERYREWSRVDALDDAFLEWSRSSTSRTPSSRPSACCSRRCARSPRPAG